MLEKRLAALDREKEEAEFRALLGAHQLADYQQQVATLLPSAMKSLSVEAAYPLRQLASALDVSRADLRAALRELRRSAVNGWEEHQKELAQFLADRFDLDADKVSDALGELAPPLSPHPPPLPHHLPPL